MKETEIFKIIANSSLPDIEEVRNECLKIFSQEKRNTNKYIYAIAFCFIFIIGLGIFVLNKDNSKLLIFNEKSKREQIKNIDFENPLYLKTNSLHFEKNTTLIIAPTNNKIYNDIIIYMVGDGPKDIITSLSNDNKYFYDVVNTGEYIFYYEKNGKIYNISNELTIDISIANQKNKEGEVIPLD